MELRQGYIVNCVIIGVARISSHKVLRWNWVSVITICSKTESFFMHDHDRAYIFHCLWTLYWLTRTMPAFGGLCHDRRPRAKFSTCMSTNEWCS